jgi:hypothetical protein
MLASFLFSSVGPYQLVAIAALVYLQFMWANAPPLSGGVFLTSVSVASLPFSKHAEDSYATPAFSCKLVYLQFTWGSAPPPLSGDLGPLPSLLCVHFFYCLFIIQVFFFVFFCQSVLGAMLIFPRCSCRRNTCCLFAHLCVCQAG